MSILWNVYCGYFNSCLHARSYTHTHVFRMWEEQEAKKKTLAKTQPLHVNTKKEERKKKHFSLCIPTKSRLNNSLLGFISIASIVFVSNFCFTHLGSCLYYSCCWRWNEYCACCRYSLNVFKHIWTHRARDIYHSLFYVGCISDLWHNSLSLGQQPANQWTNQSNNNNIMKWTCHKIKTTTATSKSAITYISEVSSYLVWDIKRVR